MATFTAVTVGPEQAPYRPLLETHVATVVSTTMPGPTTVGAVINMATIAATLTATLLYRQVHRDRASIDLRVIVLDLTE